MEENELSETGLPGGKAVLNVGQSRMRAKYWRKIGEDWVQTGLLPADPMSRNLYFSKGFLGKPPVDEVVETIEEPNKVSGCPWCDYTTENPRALRTHLNTHIKSKKEENE